MANCKDCKFYTSERKIKKWEMSNIFYNFYVCSVRKGVENLAHFPFRNTTCTKFEAIGVVGNGTEGTGNGAKRAQAGRK